LSPLDFSGVVKQMLRTVKDEKGPLQNFLGRFEVVVIKKLS
jgi:hypothetical protein